MFYTKSILKSPWNPFVSDFTVFPLEMIAFPPSQTSVEYHLPSASAFCTFLFSFLCFFLNPRSQNILCVRFFFCIKRSIKHNVIFFFHLTYLSFRWKRWHISLHQSFRWVLASLQEDLSVRPSVHPSFRLSITMSVRRSIRMFLCYSHRNKPNIIFSAVVGHGEMWYWNERSMNVFWEAHCI